MTRTGKRSRAASLTAIFDLAGATAAPMTHEPMTPIVFNGPGAQIIAGAESQQVYCFSANDPEQMVDARDAEALLKTGLFRINC